MAWRPAQELFGLWVDFGHFSKKSGRWVRPPYARYCCPRGCTYETHPAHDGLDGDRVAQFTAAVDAHHARYCPGPETTERSTR